MKLEVGKRYVMRNGYITNAIAENSNSNVNVWTDGTLHWLVGGQYSSVHYISPLDIVGEYVEPKPQQPLRWVENTKPDKPGIWAKQCGYTVHIYHCQQESNSWSEGTWCYLGPIPEILPPVKKVVERLWVANAGGQFIEQWSEEEDFSNQYALTDWIRTDRTREREI